MIHKPTFLHQNKPLITAMVQAKDPETMSKLIRTASFDGCDAFGFQMERLDAEYHTDEVVRNLFMQMGNRPIYATNYRIFANEGKSEEELAQGYLRLLELGATLIDVIGDLYAPAQYEITRDPVAIEKQKKLIEQIHANGGEVLMSSHTHTFMSTEVVLDIAREHQARGADISKIVTASNSVEEEMENLRTITVLQKELDIPFLFLAGGTHCKRIRALGPMFGCCMWLTVPLYDECATNLQPLCRSIRAIKNNFDG